MTDRPRRNIDRVLEAEFVEGVESMTAADIRARRQLAQEVEEDLSYSRRLLHGQLDILRDEVERRQAASASAEKTELAEKLSRVLAKGTGGGSRGARSKSGSRAAAIPRRRLEDQTTFGVHLARLPDLELAQVVELIEKMVAEEQRISDMRRRVHDVVDALTSALLAGYREGRLSADDLLKGEGAAADG